MPYRVLLSPEAAVAIVELSGVVRGPDVTDPLRALYLHPSFASDSAVLWDGSGLASVDIAPAALDDIRAALEDVAGAREGGRTAILVPLGGNAELWSLFPRLGPPCTRRVEVFHSRREALGFLGRAAMPEGLTVAAEG